MLFLNKTVLAFITSCYLLTTAAAGQKDTQDIARS